MCSIPIVLGTGLVERKREVVVVWWGVGYEKRDA
jgi:hypothetical protein